MKVKNNCKMGDLVCPMLQKKFGKNKQSFYYRCGRMDRELKTVVNCEYAGDFEKQTELLIKKGALTMAEKMKQTLIELKRKVADLLEAEWSNITEAYLNHDFSLSANVKIVLDGESMNVVQIQPILSFYPMPKTEIKTDKFTVDEKQKKLFTED